MSAIKLIFIKQIDLLRMIVDLQNGFQIFFCFWSFRGGHIAVHESAFKGGYVELFVVSETLSV